MTAGGVVAVPPSEHSLTLVARCWRALARRPDLLGLAWTFAAAVAVLAPALRPGVSLGPFDILSRFGLTADSAVRVHSTFPVDQIEQFVPWSYLAWHQVHAGHLPLWNQYSVLGTPLAFNWQSAVFSLPNLISYLFPVHLAYTVVVLVKLMVAGTGAYVLCRVLGLGVLASAFGGTIFELSGPIVVHAGWSMVGVTAWTGWILAAAILLMRGRHTIRYTAVLAVAIAFAVYAGHPEGVLVLAVAVVVFVAVYTFSRFKQEGWPVLRPIVRLVVAGGCGVGLSAPLLLPGAQIAAASARRYGSGPANFPLTHLPNIVAAGIGAGGHSTVSYVGLITAVLAVVGARATWRKPEGSALIAVVVVTAFLTFLSPVDDLLHVLPDGKQVGWSRAVMVMALALAALGALGLDALTKRTGEQDTGDLTRWAGGALALAGIVLVGIAIGAATGAWKVASGDESALIPPAVEVVVGLAVVWAVWRRRRTSPRTARMAFGQRLASISGALLLALETGVLLAPGISFWSTSNGAFPRTAGTAALQRAVGSGLVGFGSCERGPASAGPPSPQLGIRPDANIAYGVRELAVYDPVLAQAYFRSWRALSGDRTPEYLAKFGIFCAQITTVEEALVYGVQFVLEPAGRAGPPGTVLVADAAGENLYRVPGAADATVVPAPRDGVLVPVSDEGRPVTVREPDAETWTVDVDDASPQVLRLRLTAAPGWRATVDGRPLSLRTWDHGLMLEARVPDGRHVVELHYLPSTFDVGVGAAAITVLGLGAWSVGGVLRRRSNRGENRGP